MTIDIGLAAEDTALANYARQLGDLALCQSIDWLTDVLAAMRRWRGLEEDSEYLPLGDAFKIARSRRLRVHGHFDGQPGAPDAHMARAALLLFSDCRASRQPSVVVLARDTDGLAERQSGLEQAIASANWDFAVILAAANPEAEAWVVAGFQPENDAEALRLAELKAELHFDPTEQPERLTSTAHSSKKDAKRVCEILTQGERSRIQKCLHANLENESALACGLASYLAEVRRVLVPIFAGHPRAV